MIQRILRVNKYAAEVLDFLTQGLTLENPSRKIDNNPPNSGIMAVDVDWIGHIQEGDIFAVSHSYVQNGDVMMDPEMEFLKEQDGHTFWYYPLSFRQDGLGVHRHGVEYGEKITVIHTREQADETTFATLWMKNIKQQQKLG